MQCLLVFFAFKLVQGSSIDICDSGVSVDTNGLREYGCGFSDSILVRIVA